MSNMLEDVKFKFISYFCVTAQKLDMEIRYIKTIIKAFVGRHSVVDSSGRSLTEVKQRLLRLVRGWVTVH
jgi:hypothetical protein